MGFFLGNLWWVSISCGTLRVILFSIISGFFFRFSFRLGGWFVFGVFGVLSLGLEDFVFSISHLRGCPHPFR